MTRKPLLGAAPRMEILKGLDFTIPTGRGLGIVGGFGVWQIHLGRALVRLLDPSSGGRASCLMGMDITHHGMRRRCAPCGGGFR